MKKKLKDHKDLAGKFSVKNKKNHIENPIIWTYHLVTHHSYFIEVIFQ